MRGKQDPIPYVLPADDLPSVLPVRPGRKRGLAAFGQGLAAPCRGFVYMAERPSLWPYGLLPVLVNLLLSVALLAGLWYGLGALQDRLDAYFAEWFGSGFFGRILHGITLFAVIVAAWAVALLVAVAAWYLFQGILCDIFYRKLVRRVELQFGARPEELREVSFLADVLDTCLALGALIFFNLCFLFLHCVPVIGSVLALACTLYLTCWVFGITFLGYPLLMRGVRRRQRIAFAREHRGQTLGIGSVVFLCNLLPIVNAVLLTSAVVGAVLVHREVRPSSRPEEVLEALPADQPRRR
jgi:CysZ protein